MDERAFYIETTTTRAAELNCPHCRVAASYELQWILRRKKERLSGNADERDRARFAKAQSYMVLIDDKVMCANVQCRKRFDVSGIKTMAFLSAEQEAALPAAQPQRRPGQGNRQQQGRRGPKSGSQQRGRRDNQQQGRDSNQGNSWRDDRQPDSRDNQQQGRKRQQKQKKKRPKVYFPSDYVNYRP
jgi:hypothetical protein